MMEWMTATEAENRWKLGKNTVRNACNRKRSFKVYLKRGLIRKSGSTWLVTDEAMKIDYGEEKDD